MKNSKSDGVSIADIITLIGVLASGVTVGLGIAYFTFNMLAAVLAAIGVCIIEGILIGLIVKFKKKDENLDKWRIAEYLCVGILILVGVGTIFPVSYFTGVMQDKDQLQGVARQDISAIREGIANVQQQERNSLERTCEGLNNMLVSSASRSAQLINFADHQRITSAERVNQYRTDQDRLIQNITVKSSSGSGTESYADAWNAGLQEAETYVEGWSVFMLPIGIETIESVNKQAKEITDKMAGELQYPLIQRDNNVYLITEDNQEIMPYDAEMKFRKALKQVSVFSVTGVAIAVVTFILIFFSYLVAPRSRRMEINKNRTLNQGQIL